MDSKLIGLISVFFLVFGVFISVIFFNKNIATFTRAKEETNPSSAKSIILAYPLTVKADNQDSSSITVWVRNDNGAGINDKKVTVTTTSGTIDNPTQQTDKNGQIVFKLHSSTPSQSIVSAIIEDSTPTSNTVTINFVAP